MERCQCAGCLHDEPCLEVARARRERDDANARAVELERVRDDLIPRLAASMSEAARLRGVIRDIADDSYDKDSTPRKVARAALKPAPTSSLEQIGTSLEDDALEPAP